MFVCLDKEKQSETLEDDFADLKMPDTSHKAFRRSASSSVGIFRSTNSFSSV